jgi:hypothetical protein
MGALGGGTGQDLGARGSPKHRVNEGGNVLPGDGALVGGGRRWVPVLPRQRGGDEGWSDRRREAVLEELT